MKQCHACGQKLPLKAGQVIEFRHTGTHEWLQGVVVNDNLREGWVSLVTFGGVSMTQPEHLVTRLHGYYRITEREPLA